MDDWGADRFRAEMEQRLGRPLAPPRALRWDQTGDHLGWHEQHDGRWYLGVFVENGRVQDVDGCRQKTAFRELVTRFRPEVRLTPHQNALFTNLEASQRRAVEDLLRAHGVPLVSDLSNALRFSMACPAMPTCGLAMADSERALPRVIRQIEAALAEVGLADERLSVRMTGCPNGCARPYLGDIGFVGRTIGRYQIWIGGDFEGTRLSEVLADVVPEDDLVVWLRPLFALFRDERQSGESFGNFCHRLGIERLRAVATPALAGATR